MKYFSSIVAIGALITSILASPVSAERSLTLLEIKRAPGANTEMVDFFEQKVLAALSDTKMFSIKSKVALAALIEKMGGCGNDECYRSAAKELGIDLLAIGQLRKQRAEFIATISVVDTKLGETVIEISEKLPGDVMLVSDKWVKDFVLQLEPLSLEAEAIDAKELAESEEAAKATVIMQDEIDGTLSTDKSPYLLVGNVVVPANKTLTIEKGVTVLVGGDYSTIVVYGQIMAEGVEGAPIVFKSAKKDAKAWDWDRIYIRGNQRSYFTWCTISNSNFGIHVDNGNATIANCSFQNNSISCIYALQSDVQVRYTQLGKGHIVGLNVDRGSKVSVDSGLIHNITHGVVCHPFSTLNMSRTRIEDNDFGIITDKRAQVKLEDIWVLKNRVGVLTDQEIKSNRLFMIKRNVEDLRVVTPEEVAKLMPEPQKITAVKVREKEFRDTVGFKGDFLSAPSRGESFTARMGLLGQVSLGLTYRAVNDLNESVHANIADSALPHQTTYIPGFRPELSLYLQSKVGDRESDLTINGYGNYNKMGSTTGDDHLRNLEAYRNIQKFEVINLTTTLPGHEIVLGDFSEDQSEISVSSRQIRGLKYEKTSTLEQGRSLDMSISGGQSTIPYPKGLKPDMLDSNTTPIRQEWLGLASVKSNVSRDLSVGAHFLTTRHVNNPILYPGVSLDSTELYGADPKLQSYNSGINATMQIRDNLSAFAEVDIGYADTLSTDVDSGDGSSFAYSKDTLIHHNFNLTQMTAGLIGVNFNLSGFDATVEYIRAQHDFYTGGNPSIKPQVGNLNKARFNGSKSFDVNILSGLTKSIDLNTAFDWEAAAKEETSIKPDFLGEDPIMVADSVAGDSVVNDPSLSFLSQPVENKLKGGLDIKMPIGPFSFEPNFSYYYEWVPALKRDAKSKDMKISVDGSEETVNATEYTDAEGRMTFGGALVYIPSYSSEVLTSMRLKLDGGVILINDMNRFDPALSYADTLQWEKNDGHQIKTKFDFALKLFKSRIGNKLKTSYQIRTKKYKDEAKQLFRLEDRFEVKVIPQKLTLNLKGYFSNQNTDYKEEKNNADGVWTGAFNKVNEVLKVYGVESEIKVGLTIMMSISVKGGYEYGTDTAESGGENFKTYYGGGVFNLLF
ncbi:MAG: hypothetical protein A2268_04410 [Candidatus Raymondbacteria bacterium RifOxyA12_full_50_37]|uniref:Right handed beta helix domain-containing protein n=1 Tax=Candidatus Raymondbacteria bacterium RIFOXYD12_FULL_49_13 TaxID=1817890 RepID=A0A1F7FBC9_UNCRA|nr:MAG: hypothetical protein A2268_04410 [Candidatus Raymondbacteria bacterium RifOxyA12_full_50_37]OGJ87710.1 MAG: hypothetical protein A2350_13655 [Candidatus Raymondbacteria bacterium RifOxyB12_full_50_8]OGJ92535.1 MAG: hypothetical protein A2248_05540 [Candidatus Raymondbacteria bacterium RIFOXYA2_FULL_49_16]OGJ97889.1 MAG: hypothetical protein A2453_02565 [Candidatus Raymondbacteria bacterium RIFOXYC2_FULL_50_21]OGK03832.1 MAG: hypothetical protein A2519_02250 [Candidatus Raymondbacteria b